MIINIALLLVFVPLRDGQSHTPREGAGMDEILLACELVAAVLGEGLDRDDVTGLHLDDRRDVTAEIAPMHGVAVGWQVVVLDPRQRRKRR